MIFKMFIKLPHTCMTQHLTIMKCMINELTQVSYEMTDQQKVQAVIRSIPKSCDNFCLILTHNDNITNFTQVLKKCRVEEQRLLNEKLVVAKANVVNSK